MSTRHPLYQFAIAALAMPGAAQSQQAAAPQAGDVLDAERLQRIEALRRRLDRIAEEESGPKAA